MNKKIRTLNKNFAELKISMKCGYNMQLYKCNMDRCHNILCNECVDICDICGYMYCNDCMTICEECTIQLCNRCIVYNKCECMLINQQKKLYEENLKKYCNCPKSLGGCRYARKNFNLQ